MSSSGKDTTSRIDSRFGRCQYFAFYNTEDQSWAFLSNPGALQGSGAGIKAAQFVADHKAGVVLTGETGPKASQVLASAGLEVIHIPEMPLQEALESYLKEKGGSGGRQSSATEQEAQKASAETTVQAPVSEGKIAVATEGADVASHFGRCPEYTLVDLSAGKVTGKKVVPNPGHQPGFLPRFLGEMGVNCVIAGGMGMRAQNLFAEQGIQTVVGVTGPVDDALSRYLAGQLAGGESLCSHPQGHDSCGGH